MDKWAGSWMRERVEMGKSLVEWVRSQPAGCLLFKSGFGWQVVRVWAGKSPNLPHIHDALARMC